MFGRGRNTRARADGPLHDFSWRRGSSVGPPPTEIKVDANHNGSGGGRRQQRDDGIEEADTSKLLRDFDSPTKSRSFISEKGPSTPRSTRRQTDRGSRDRASRGRSLSTAGSRGSEARSLSNASRASRAVSEAIGSCSRWRWRRQEQEQPAAERRPSKLLSVIRKTSGGSGHSTESTSPSTDDGSSQSSSGSSKGKTSHPIRPRSHSRSKGLSSSFKEEHVRQRTRSSSRTRLSSSEQWNEPMPRREQRRERRPERHCPVKTNAPPHKPITSIGSSKDRLALLRSSAKRGEAPNEGTTARGEGREERLEHFREARKKQQEQRLMLRELHLHQMMLRQQRSGRFQEPRSVDPSASESQAVVTMPRPVDDGKEEKSSVPVDDSKEEKSPVPKKPSPRSDIEAPLTPPDTSDCHEDRHNGFRPDYKLGDSLRDTSHMVPLDPSSAQYRSATSLRDHDYAFLKRSDGSYTYSILSFRNERSMTFVVDTEGNRKRVGRRRWAEFVRLVALDEERATTYESKSSRREEGRGRSSSLHRSTRSRRSSDSWSVLCCSPVDNYNKNLKEKVDGEERVDGEAGTGNADGKLRKEKKGWIPTSVSFAPGKDDDDCSELSNMSDLKPPILQRKLKRYCDELSSGMK